MKYGIISDTHHNPATIEPLVAMLKNNNVDALVLNGDIGEETAHVVYTLRTAALSGLPVYAQPGSHEDVPSYVEAMEHLQWKYPNIIDCVQHPKHEQNDHHVIFLAGSDVTAGAGSFLIEQQTLPTGYYFLDGMNKEVKPFKIKRNFLRAYTSTSIPNTRLLHMTDIADLEKLVTMPEKTVVFCHIPERFDNDHSTDYAYFAERNDGKGFIPGIMLEIGLKKEFGKDLTPEQLQKLANERGFTFKKANVGNQALSETYKKLNITKRVNGHIHESAHHAHNSVRLDIPEGTPVTDLAYNASYADAGLAGILTVQDNKTNYENVSLKSKLAI